MNSKSDKIRNLIAFTLFLMFLSTIAFSQVTEMPIDISVQDIAPKVREITVSPTPVDLIAGGEKAANLSATITDPDGNLASCRGYLWNATTTSYAETDAWYVNSSCYLSSTGASGNCECSFNLIYYDLGGSWIGNITGVDGDSNEGFNSSAFVVNDFTSSSLTNIPITFPSPLFLGDTNRPATNNPLKINNTGNVALRTYINASDFTGVAQPTEEIAIGNMTMNSSATGMETITSVTFVPQDFSPSGGIPIYPNSVAGIIDIATHHIYHYINIPSYVVAQDYSTLYWLEVQQF